MGRAMKPHEYADFMSRIKKAVKCRIENPDMTLVQIGKKFGVSKCSLTKYSAQLHPEKFKIVKRRSRRRPVPEQAEPPKRKPRLRRALFADAGDGWVRPECVPAGKFVQRFEVLEYLV